MKKFTLTALFLLSAILHLPAQNNFYSVLDGDFSKEIWATSSGATSPCPASCFTYTCTSDVISLNGNNAIHIRNAVSTSCEMQLAGTFDLIVENGGHLTIDDGYGITGDGSLIIDAGGSVTITGDMALTGSSQVIVNGTLIVNGIVSFGGNACMTGTGTAQAADVSGSNCPEGISILPVELLFFRAKAYERNVELSWATASQKNNAWFVIERSGNGSDFVPLGRIEGAGNSSSTKNYSYADEVPPDGVSYYRLRQIDFDGRYTVSEIVAVRFNSGSTAKLFPNPVEKGNKTFIDVSAMNDRDMILRVYDASGKLLSSNVYSNGHAGDMLSLNTENLPGGFYTIMIQSGERSLFRKLLVR